MIKKTVTPNMVRFESTEPEVRGKVELLAFVTEFTLKHNILSVSSNWIKPRSKNGHTLYFSDYYGEHYEKAKAEEV
jgi:hypothetical protein